MPAPTSTPATTMSASTSDRTASGGAPRPTYHEPTFRTWPPESVTRRDGTMMTTIVCEDLVDGRWEPFCSIREHRPPRQPAASAPWPQPSGSAEA